VSQGDGAVKTPAEKLLRRLGAWTWEIFGVLAVAPMAYATASPWARESVGLVVLFGALIALGLHMKWKDGKL
jgi:hypothetical protein